MAYLVIVRVVNVGVSIRVSVSGEVRVRVWL